MPKTPPRLQCLDHLPTDEERRAWDQLDEARRQAAEWWRKELSPSKLEQKRRGLKEYDFWEMYFEEIGKDPTPWSRVEKGDSEQRIGTARRWGRSPFALFDMAPPRETPLPKTMILRPPEGPPKPLTPKQRKDAKARAAVSALVERSHEFTRSWVVYRVAAATVRFLRALRTDVNKKFRVPQNTSLKGRSADEAREAVYKKYVKPQLPSDLVHTFPLDRFPDKDHEAERELRARPRRLPPRERERLVDPLMAQAKAIPRPDPVSYYHDLVTILRRELGYRPLRAARVARENVIRDLGLDRIDPKWVRVWEQIKTEEEERHDIDQEDVTEP